MKKVNPYISFTSSYRQWHFRMTTASWKQRDPCTGLSALQTANFFSLAIVSPLIELPPLVFSGLSLVVGVICYFLNRRIFKNNPIVPMYAKVTDNVPSFREFPSVYSYLLISFLLFVGCAAIVIGKAS